MTTNCAAERDPSEVARLLSVRDLARIWSLREDTVRAMARRGTLPSVKVGTLVRFRACDLADFLACQRVP